MNKLERIQKRNNRLSNAAAFADVIIAYASAPFAAVRGVRRDVKGGKKLHFCDLYKLHFREHIADRNSSKLYLWSLDRADARIAKYRIDNVVPYTKYNPQNEITAKGLTNVVEALSGTTLKVRYFESTEHQNPTPKRCCFGDNMIGVSPYDADWCGGIPGDNYVFKYMIDFASDGTDWCDGMRGNGYVFEFYPNEGYRQIAALSTKLSDYFANIADEKFKMQQQQKSLSR